MNWPLAHWQLLDWLLYEGKSLGMKVSSVPWQSDPPGFPKDIVCADFSYKDMSCFGLGHHLNRSISYTIAAAEALERAAMYEFKLKNSNGCSVHTDPEQARINSLKELSERDAFLYHFESGAAPREPKTLKSSEYHRQMMNWADQRKVRVRVRSMDNILGFTTLMSCIDGFDALRPHAFFLGFGTADSEETAFAHSLAECLRFYESWLKSPERFSPLTLENFLEMRGKGIMEHVRLGFDPDYASEFNRRLFHDDAKVRPASERALESVAFKGYALSDLWSQCPLHFCVAASPLLSEIHFGDSWSSSHSPGASGTLPRIPHCLG